MASFKNEKGDEYTIGLDAMLLHTLRAETCGVEGCKHRPRKDPDCDGVDLIAPDGSTYADLVADPFLMVGVLWILCRKQADAKGKNFEQFVAEITGDSIQLALHAISEAVADFFPQSKRAVLRAITAKSEKLQALGLTKAIERLENPELETLLVERLDRQLDAALGKTTIPSTSATSSPASAG